MMERVMPWALVVCAVAATNGLSAARAFAQSNPPQVVIFAGQAMPEKLKSGNQYYDFTVSGIEEYMDDLERRSPGTYASLQDDYHELIDAESAGVTWALVVAGVGFVACVAGSVMMAHDDINGLYLFGAGLTVGTLGAFGVYALISPGRDEMRQFVNQHNRAYPEKPLELHARHSGHGPTLGLRLATRF